MPTTVFKLKILKTAPNIDIDIIIIMLKICCSKNTHTGKHKSLSAAANKAKRKLLLIKHLENHFNMKCILGLTDDIKGIELQVDIIHTTSIYTFRGRTVSIIVLVVKRDKIFLLHNSRCLAGERHITFL